jgi:hypothetical protein
MHDPARAGQPAPDRIAAPLLAAASSVRLRPAQAAGPATSDIPIDEGQAWRRAYFVTPAGRVRGSPRVVAAPGPNCLPLRPRRRGGRAGNPLIASRPGSAPAGLLTPTIGHRLGMKEIING